MSVPTEEQLAKLPKWAREYIKTLEYATADAQRKHRALFDSQEPTSILFGDVYDNPRYLPDARVEFIRVLTEGKGLRDQYVDIRRTDPHLDSNSHVGGVYLSTSGPMEIIPISGNVVVVRPRTHT